MVWHRIGQKSVRATLGTERVCVSVGSGVWEGLGEAWEELEEGVHCLSWESLDFFFIVYTTEGVHFFFFFFLFLLNKGFIFFFFV